MIMNRIRNSLFAFGTLLALAGAAATALAAEGPATDERIERLLGAMSLEEKIGQLTLKPDIFIGVDGTIGDPIYIERLRQAVREGRLGGLLHFPFVPAGFPAGFDELQKLAVEESRHGIPLIYGHDVIHGYKTIFPIPLGQAASWSAELVEEGARVAAVEATSDGIRWTYAPMVDISRDARWGRIAESLGEDVHLASALSAAMVRGFQGEDTSLSSSLAACPKHYVAYGAVEGGRDYNAAYVPEALLRNVHLPPFKAAFDAGALTVMSAYMDLNGIPASGNHFTLTQVLRDEWGFEGFVVSDFFSVLNLIVTGYAADAADAARQSLSAGIDFDMGSGSFEEHLPALVEAGEVDVKLVDRAVRRMLRVKMAMGLFERPYPDRSRKHLTLSTGHLDSARHAAAASFVLLKNDDGLLPVRKSQSVAVIGPLAEAPFQQLGSWAFHGDKKDSRTLLPALREYLGEGGSFSYAQGLAYSRSRDTALFDEALAVAKEADLILFFGGEESILTGEAHSRGDISLPGAQPDLFARLAALGKPIALIILAGRPISLEGILDKADAVMMAWHPGTMAGPALVDVLYGERSPSGHLPLTWPKAAGQIPVYYDHTSPTRPATDDNYTLIDDIDPAAENPFSAGFSSNYLDYGHRPEFPFGHGLSYTTFDYGRLRLNKRAYRADEVIKASVRVKNTGKSAGTDVVQLYIRDPVATLTRPVAQLKGFKRVELRPGRSRTVRFELPVKELGFYKPGGQYVVEPGDFVLWVGQDSADTGLSKPFKVVR